MKYPVRIVSQHECIELARYSDHIPRIGECVGVSATHGLVYVHVTAVYHEQNSTVVVEAELLPQQFDVLKSTVAEAHRFMTDRPGRTFL